MDAGADALRRGALYRTSGQPRSRPQALEHRIPSRSEQRLCQSRGGPGWAGSRVSANHHDVDDVPEIDEPDFVMWFDTLTAIKDGDRAGAATGRRAFETSCP